MGATNAVRIRPPISDRVGMFWRLGSDEESRPVAVAVWWKLVWILPVDGWIAFGS